MYCYIPDAPRLACVRPVASVHPEPGSNSSLYISFFLIFSTSKVVPSALMPDYLSSGFEFVLTLTCFLYPLLSGYPSRTTFVYCNAFKDLVLLSAFVKRKWCKDNAFLFFLPNFQKFFFIFSSYRSPLPKSVAKIRLFIPPFQIFYRVFYAKFYNFSQAPISQTLAA